MRKSRKPTGPVYLRVSKGDGRQQTANQLRELRAWFQREGWTMAAVYEDHASGRWGRDRRPELRRLLEDVRVKRWDFVAVWAFDRLTRQGILQALIYIHEIEMTGARFRSLREPHLNDDHSPLRPLMLSHAAQYAADEIERLSARTKAGLAVAKENGATFGRPVIVTPKVISRIKKFRARGWTIERIAEKVGVSASSVSRNLKMPANNQTKKKPNNSSNNRVKNRR